MYDKNFTKIIDRREMLRVKLKNLAQESKLIRREELRLHRPQQIGLRMELWKHRISIVRNAARETHLAYGFIKGHTLHQMEAKSATPPNWESIVKMVKKYGNGSIPDTLRDAMSLTLKKVNESGAISSQSV